MNNAAQGLPTIKLERPIFSLGRLVISLSILLLLPFAAIAGEPVSKSRLGGVAIGGQDTVAYHDLAPDPHQESVGGAKAWVVKWKGAKWRFASQESSEKFSAEPAKYAPAFNGFCANALSLGKGLLRTDGTHWEIFGDRLYLFYAAKGRDRWVADGADLNAYIAAAETAWAKEIQ